MKPGDIHRVSDIPELKLNITCADQIPDDHKKLVFRELCQRYVGFKETLKNIYATHQKQESPLQRETIHLIIVAMRGLILQIVDIANALGFSAQHRHLAMLSTFRNQEAHNGDRTEITALINLGEPVLKLMKSVKLFLPVATPSQLGLYAQQKHPSPTLPVFAKNAQTGRELTNSPRAKSDSGKELTNSPCAKSDSEKELTNSPYAKSDSGKELTNPPCAKSDSEKELTNSPCAKSDSRREPTKLALT